MTQKPALVSATADLEFPNFIIVGAMKGGTSSLKHYLRQHPDVAFNTRRTNFFDQNKKWAKGPEWYAAFFEHARGTKAIGETVPAYSYRPNRKVPVPERMAQVLPDVKILWILRNPIDRAYSHYWFNVYLGRERRPFAKALAHHQKHGVEAQDDYKGRSVYVDQINLFLRYYPMEQMHILLLNDFKRDAVGAVNRVFEFLNVDPEAVVLDTSVKRNMTHRPRVLWLQGVLRKLFFKRSERLYRQIADVFAHRQPGYPPMDPALRAELAQFYAPHNTALAELTGLDLSHWDTPS